MATASPTPPRLAKATVAARKNLTEDLWAMWLKPDIPYPFKAGQYCTIGLDGIERAYSIVSAPHEPELELFIGLIEHGHLTPKLWPLDVGDLVSLRPRAKGIFTFDPALPNHLMVCTVTGIAPFVSIIRDYIHTGMKGHRFYLLQGSSYVDYFAYDREMATLSAEYPELITYVPAISRPNDERNRGWSGATGRVNNIVDGLAEKWGLDSQSTLVYLCGNPGMIQEAKKTLAPKEFRIREERFWKE